MPRRKQRDLPKVGAVFEREYKGKVYCLKVIKGPTGIAYQLSGHIFKTPTAAAKSIVQVEVNGWAFWKMDSD